MEKKKGGGEGGAFKMIIYLASTTKELVFVVDFVCLLAFVVVLYRDTCKYSWEMV